MATIQNSTNKFNVFIMHPGIKNGGYWRENLSHAEVQKTIDAVNLLGSAWDIIVVPARHGPAA